MLRQGAIYKYRNIRWECVSIDETMAKLVALEKYQGRKPRPVFVSSGAELEEVTIKEERDKIDQ